MKQKFAALAIAALLTFNATFANPKNDPLPETIKQEFKKEFLRAADVTWQAKATFYKVSFNVDGQQLEAFYSLTGDMLGVSRNITFSQLPLLLQKNLKKKYTTYWISNLFESVSQQGTAYYITFENATDQITLSGNTADWHVYQKTSKV